jgi:hypothetical protein
MSSRKTKKAQRAGKTVTSTLTFKQRTALGQAKAAFRKTATINPDAPEWMKAALNEYIMTELEGLEDLDLSEMDDHIHDEDCDHAEIVPAELLPSDGEHIHIHDESCSH